MYSPELQSRIAILQQRSLEGTLTLEEMTEGIRLMRGERTAALRASHASSAKRVKAKAEIKHADDMLSELGISEETESEDRAGTDESGSGEAGADAI